MRNWPAHLREDGAMNRASNCWKRTPSMWTGRSGARECSPATCPTTLRRPSISRYLRAPGLLSQAVFLIQKEVAERITAKPGGREYGYFSVECQFLAQTEYLFTVAPGAFRPPPKVDSAVIRLTPRPAPAVDDQAGFLGFVSICFRQKRKTLRNNLAGHIRCADARISRGAPSS